MTNKKEERKTYIDKSLSLFRKLFSPLIRLYFSLFIKFRLLKGVKLNVSGISNLNYLPKKRVLFLSNHESYFAEGMLTLRELHQFRASFSLDPDIKCVAVADTLKIQKIGDFWSNTLGFIHFNRQWKENETTSSADNRAQSKALKKAINEGWVLLYPQGTTQDGTPFRSSTAKLYYSKDVWVVPIKISNFRDTYKRSSVIPVKGASLHIEFLKPIFFPKLTKKNFDDMISSAHIIADKIGVPKE